MTFHTKRPKVYINGKVDYEDRKLADLLYNSKSPPKRSSEDDFIYQINRSEKYKVLHCLWLHKAPPGSGELEIPVSFKNG